MRICSFCKRELPLGKFNKAPYPGNPDALCYWCKDCYRWRNLLRKYGLQQQQYQDMLNAQDGRCGICGVAADVPLYVDHDHKTGSVRGLLCHKCNTGLGMFQDSLQILEAAVRYLSVDPTL